MAQLPTGTVTFLFTDIEGSTQLLQRLGPDYARALGEHQALLRAAFAAHDGAEVDTQGDAFFVAFPSAPQAVAAAAEATHALADHSWPEGATLRVRIGLHTGAPQLAGDHYIGLDVHRAARIAAAGHGGQILLSQTTRDLAKQDLPGGSFLRALGAHRLKDLQDPEPLYQLVAEGLPADFAPLNTLDTHQHNLPLQPTPLLGREQQLAALTALLRRAEVRLVTLTGSGGIGKTRLAVQVAAELLEDFADGVWFVRLSRLTDPGLVIPTIAQVLGLKEQSSQPIADTLCAHLAGKQLLLVLDNFEQVVRAANAVTGLLATSPGVKALVTSRTPLHLRGEREYTLVPLPLPDREPGRRPSPERFAQDLSQYAAVALFVERAQAARADFTVTAANAPAIAEICARLDGLPLAIELAAARVKLLPPEALLGRLASQLKLLTGGARDLEERQQTMRAAIAWSEDLLTPKERALFRRLAVFVGSATLEAVEAVCAAPEGTDPLDLDALEGLGALVDHSLVQQREEGGNGEPRFGMLQVIHEYALERLAAQADEAEALRRAHAAYFLALAERADPQLRGPRQRDWLDWLDRLEREHDNLRAALGWTRAQAQAQGQAQAQARAAAEMGLRLAVALGRFWSAHGHLREGQAWVEALLALAPLDAAEPTQSTAQLRTRALLVGGELALWRGDVAMAKRWLEEALGRARVAGHLSTTAQTLVSLGIVADQQRDLARAEAIFEEALALMRQIGDRRGVAMCLNNLGDVSVRQGDLTRAEAIFTEALALKRQVEDQVGAAISLINLGWVARQRGELTQAAALGREALALVQAQGLGDLTLGVAALEHLAATAGAMRQDTRAARLFGAATALRETIGVPQPPTESADMEEAVAAARAAMGEAAWAAAWVAGQALTLEEAIAEALGEDGENG